MSDREGILLTRDQLEAWAGPLSDADIDRLEDAIPNSSIPEAIGVIADHMDRDEFWPEPEWPYGDYRPEFVRRFGENFWTPLCRCGEPLRMPEGNVQVWECSLAPVSHQRVMLWAEDWPDFEDEEESDLALIRKYDAHHPDVLAANTSRTEKEGSS